MKGVILAGGFGTRFRPLTFTKPKPMIPLVNKPVLEHVVEYLCVHGLKNIVVTTTFLREMIMEHFRGREDVPLSFPLEQYPLGTAGSVKNAGMEQEEEPFVVIQGDNITDLDLHKLIDFHYEAGGLVTIALTRVEDPWNYGIALLESDGCISRFHERPGRGKCFSDLASTGIYVVDPKALAFVPEGIPFDFAKDLFHMLHSKEKGKMFGYELEEGEFWADVGQPRGYLQAMEWMLDKMRTDVVIGQNVEIDSSGIISPSVIGNGVVLEEGCSVGPHTVLFEDVDVGKNSSLEQCFVGEGTMIGEAACIRDATIGAHCILGRDVSVLNGTIWPFVVIPDSSTVDNILKRFVKVENGGDGHGIERKKEERILRTVSEEEAFYFNMCKKGKVVHTGFVAHKLDEFVQIVKTVDPRSIDYHLWGATETEGIIPYLIYNDFADWIRNLLGDVQLANKVARLQHEDSRDQLVGMIRERIAELNGE